jgi:hypothetical protein
MQRQLRNPNILYCMYTMEIQFNIVYEPNLLASCTMTAKVGQEELLLVNM